MTSVTGISLQRKISVSIILVLAILFLSACRTVSDDLLQERIASLSNGELEEAIHGLAMSNTGAITGLGAKQQSPTVIKLGVRTSKDKEKALVLVQQEKDKRTQAGTSSSRRASVTGGRVAANTLGGSSGSTAAKDKPVSSILTDIRRGSNILMPPSKGTLIQDITKTKTIKEDMISALGELGFSLTSRRDQLMAGDLVSMPGSHADTVFAQVGSLVGVFGSKAGLLVFGDFGGSGQGDGIPSDIGREFGSGMYSGSRNLGFYMDVPSWKAGLSGRSIGSIRSQEGGIITVVDQGANNLINVNTRDGNSVVHVPSGGYLDAHGLYYCTNGGGCDAPVKNGNIQNPHDNGLSSLKTKTAVCVNPCASGEYCDSTGTCVQGTSDKQQCGSGCASGEVCQSNQCVKKDTGSTDTNKDNNQCNPACASGKKCENGQCVDDGSSSGSQCDPLVMDCGGGMQGTPDPNDPMVKLIMRCGNPNQVLVGQPSPDGDGYVFGCAQASVPTDLGSKFGQQSQCGAGQDCEKNKLQGASGDPTPAWGRGDID